MGALCVEVVAWKETDFEFLLTNEGAIFVEVLMIKEIEFELCILYLSLNKANKTLTTKIYTNMHSKQETNVEVCIFIFHKLFTRENANIVI